LRGVYYHAALLEHYAALLRGLGRDNEAERLEKRAREIWELREQQEDLD
jgi:hypothetical protein